MGANSGISWTHHTFNPWWGCVRVSPGCEHCYAESFATKRMGLPIWGKHAERRFFGDKHWNQPRTWDRKAFAARERHRVFVASMADVFEDRPDLVAPRARLFALIEATPNLDWLLLTKRPENMIRLAPASWLTAWPPNVWAGATTEDEKRAEVRLSHLLEVPARVRFASYEPALESVDFWAFLKGDMRDQSLAALGAAPLPGLDWIIVGGESGPDARPFNPTWAKDTIAACRRAGIAPFVKQMGSNVLDLSGTKLRDRAGADPAEWPEELRVQEFPL